jgi:hypothetical protein
VAILHGRTDDAVPFADWEELAKGSGLDAPWSGIAATAGFLFPCRARFRCGLGCRFLFAFAVSLGHQLRSAGGLFQAADHAEIQFAAVDVDAGDLD